MDKLKPSYEQIKEIRLNNRPKYFLCACFIFHVLLRFCPPLFHTLHFQYSTLAISPYLPYSTNSTLLVFHPVVIPPACSVNQEWFWLALKKLHARTKSSLLDLPTKIYHRTCLRSLPYWILNFLLSVSSTRISSNYFGKMCLIKGRIQKKSANLN